MAAIASKLGDTTNLTPSIPTLHRLKPLGISHGGNTMRITLILMALLVVGNVYADVLFQESFTDGDMAGWTRDPGQTGQR